MTVRIQPHRQLQRIADTVLGSATGFAGPMARIGVIIMLSFMLTLSILLSQNPGKCATTQDQICLKVLNRHHGRSYQHIIPRPVPVIAPFGLLREA